MGATLSPLNISIDNTIYPNGIKINRLQYNDANKMPKLFASGFISFDKDVNFNNFKIKTQQPTDARIFNILFRKPFMKQGIFTSDLIINGKSSAPAIIGKLHITQVDVPIFDANINDIDMNFDKQKIVLNSKGTILKNPLTIFATMKNSFISPYIFENIKIHADNLDLNNIFARLQEYDIRQPVQIENNSFDASQLIIKNANVTANNIKIKNLKATNFNSKITLNEKMILDVDNFNFYASNGTINGNIKYNMLNNKANFGINVNNMDAEMFALDLLGLKNQIYGTINADIDLYCNGKSQDLCIKTLNGHANFKVTKGKMPKLGSLEYLLKAGNLVKSGITGLTINGLVDLVTPYKTGEFDDIKGNIKITNGIANDIQIFSAGKALNLYIKGSYNLTNMLADMQIFGGLSKNFNTLSGKITNASLNTLFNVIPGINISEVPSIITEDIKKIPNENTRMFNAEIYGDINGNNYVKSFRWLK